MIDLTMRHLPTTSRLAPCPDDHSGTEILVTVILGQPTAGGQCVHSGICDVTDTELPVRPTQARCRQARALLRVTSGQTGLLVFFPRSGMPDCTRRTFFASGRFDMPVPFTLPPVLAARLGVQSMPCIPAAQYAIESAVEGYQLTFPLVSSGKSLRRHGNACIGKH